MLSGFSLSTTDLVDFTNWTAL